MSLSSTVTEFGLNIYISRIYPLLSLSPSCIKLAPVRACTLSHFGRVWLFAAPRSVGFQAPMSVGFSRQEYWSGLPCSPSGVFPDPGIEPTSSVSPALQVDSLPLSHRGSRTCSFIQLNTDQDYFGSPMYSLHILQSSWNLLTPSCLHVYGHHKSYFPQRLFLLPIPTSAIISGPFNIHGYLSNCLGSQILLSPGSPLSSFQV